MTPEELQQRLLDWSWQRSFKRGESLVIERLRDVGLDDGQILAVLGVLENICPYCWDGPWDCQCWNDE